MESIVKSFDESDTVHNPFEVHTRHVELDFLVPDGKVMDHYEYHEITRHDCGDPSISVIQDGHFPFPIGARLNVSITSGPIGDEFEGRITGTFVLFFKDLTPLEKQGKGVNFSAHKSRS
jgi:hypothetical protein